MAESDIVRRIARIAEASVRAAGLEIWGVEYIASGRGLVRIYVDTPAAGEGASPDSAAREAGGGGPGIEQCAAVSRRVALALDAEDMFPHAYILELSSPGLDRVFFSLSQLRPYVGRVLELDLAFSCRDMSGRRRLRGRLLAVGEESFSFMPDDAERERSFRWEEARRIRLVPVLPFPRPGGPGKKKGARRG
jgi:ribosome maturation factor RimP